MKCLFEYSVAMFAWTLGMVSGGLWLANITTPGYGRFLVVALLLLVAAACMTYELMMDEVERTPDV